MDRQIPAPGLRDKADYISKYGFRFPGPARIVMAQIDLVKRAVITDFKGGQK